MPRTLISYKGEKITIDDKAMYSGGEGAIHPVLGNGKKRVAKLYHSSVKAQAFHQKILFMVNNPPFGQVSQAISDAIVWPEDLLFENNAFVGYVMTMVEGGIKLFMLTLPKLAIKDNPLSWAKFAPTNPDSLLVRLKVCYNLARAVELLHQSGKYVLVDLKPENVMIKPNGHFSIIDLDSIQIVGSNKLLFHATAYTPEYTPSELHQGTLVFGKDMVPASFDHFSLAVINYQLLLNIHPFQASHNQYTSIEENIQHGLFVHGNRKKQLAVIPAIHNGFSQLPKNLQKLFTRALEHGYLNPSFRPTAIEWANELLHEIKDYSRGKHNHCQAKYLNAQPTKNSPSAKPKGILDYEQPVWNTFQKHIYTKGIIINNQNNAISSLINKVRMKAPTLHLIKNFKKYAAIFILLICSAFLVVVYTQYKSNNREKALAIINRNMIHNLSGKYYGLIISGNEPSYVAYLQIYQSGADSTKFAVRLLTDVFEASEIEQLTLDPRTKKIHSTSLGEGIFKQEKNGKIILMSNKYNLLSWRFEK